MTYNRGRYTKKSRRSFGFASSPKIAFKGPTKAAICKSKMDGWVDVHSPYNKEYVETLKTVIQPSHRKWDAEQSVWHVNQIYLEELVGILKMYFDEVTTDLVDDPNSSASASSVPDNMFLPVLEALKGLSDGTMEKVFRSLAFAVHPDAGGSTELMTKLNEAHEQVRK